MDCTEPHRREHREHRLRDHRHVDQDSIALANTLCGENRGEAVDLGGELAIAISPALIRLGRNEDERRLLGACREMAIDGVMAEVGAAADEPACKGRAAVIEHLRKGRLPIDQRRPLPPECVAIVQGSVMRLGVVGHRDLPIRVPGQTSPLRQVPYCARSNTSARVARARPPKGGYRHQCARRSCLAPGL